MFWNNYFKRIELVDHVCLILYSCYYSSLMKHTEKFYFLNQRQFSHPFYSLSPTGSNLKKSTLEFIALYLSQANANINHYGIRSKIK
jgi:hypothetical protein